MKNNLIHPFAPGFSIDVETLLKVKNTVKDLGLTATIPDDLIKEDIFEYANTETYRRNHIKTLLQSQEASVLWMLRGGRGSSALLKGLEDLSDIPFPKLFVGYSDVTAFHLYAQAKNWPSLHGIGLAYNQEMGTSVNCHASLKDIIRILDGTTQQLSYTLTPENTMAKTKNYRIDNTSIGGGNLSLIQRSIGTYTHLITKNKILFIEDTGENPTKTYEALIHLDRAGLFDAPKGIIWGNFSPKEEDIEGYAHLKKEFSQKMNERNIPVFSSDLFGHGPYNNPLMFNTPTTIFVKNNNEAEIIIQTIKA